MRSYDIIEKSILFDREGQGGAGIKPGSSSGLNHGKEVL